MSLRSARSPGGGGPDLTSPRAIHSPLPPNFSSPTRARSGPSVDYRDRDPYGRGSNPLSPSLPSPKPSSGSSPGATRPGGGGGGAAGEHGRSQRPKLSGEEVAQAARQQYIELLEFLRTYLAKDAGPRTNAREKLTRLSRLQFHELSTDVYDELVRRQNGGERDRQQAGGKDFHPKRNQARQKLATLPRSRFKDLAGDVFFELERRFPDLKAEFRPNADREPDEREKPRRKGSKDTDGTFSPQPSKSDLIIPSKSTLVEEQIEVPYANANANANAKHPVDHSEIADSDPGSESDGFGGRRRRSLEDRDRDRDDGSTKDDNRSTVFSQSSSIGTGFFNGYASGAPSTTGLSVGDRGSGFGSRRGVSGVSDFEDTEKIRSDYEFRIATMQSRIANLEKEADELRAQAKDGGAGSEQIRELEADLRREKERNEGQQSLLRSLQVRLEETEEQLRAAEEKAAKARDVGESSVREELESVRRRFDGQEEVIGDLQKEVSTLLDELRALSARNEEMLADKDADVARIRDLDAQVASYKKKYEAAKTELRNIKATSQLFVQPPNADDFMPATADGVIADVHLTAFQSSIDELLASGRSHSPSSVLGTMKQVVVAHKMVMDDVESFNDRAAEALSVADYDQLQGLKTKAAATLNNLMTASRNHATSQSLSPVSLLDAAASHVSSTIVDIAKLLKVRRASKFEFEQSELAVPSAAGRMSMLRVPGGGGGGAPTNGWNTAGAPSSPSSLSPRLSPLAGLRDREKSAAVAPPPPPYADRGANGYDDDEEDEEKEYEGQAEDWEELKNYIETQTEAIVHSIQSLLSSIREGAQGKQLNENLTQIVTIVGSIVAISQDNLPAASRAEGEPILRELETNCEKLSELQARPAFDKATKTNMASASYGIAKGLKALNSLLQKEVDEKDDLR